MNQNNPDKTGKNRLPYVAPRVDIVHVQLEDFLAVSAIHPSVKNQKAYYIDYDEIDMETPAGRDVLIL
jgi:hypothetical protein